VTCDRWIPDVRSPIVALATLVAMSASVAAQSRPAAPDSQPLSRDEALWREILAADRALFCTEPYAADVEAALRSRRTLLERARVYLSAYPGGTRWCASS
jgi:hypothetical protein